MALAYIFKVLFDKTLFFVILDILSETAERDIIYKYMFGKLSVLALLIILLTALAHPSLVKAESWYYPISRPEERVTVNPYGVLHNQNYYVGKESLFPFNRFSGYHAGVDFEVLPEETNLAVPIYAVSSGKIVYAKSVVGYGGLIIQTVADNQHLALYGHVKLDGIKVGNTVTAGDKLTDLGGAFSAETGKERKHLHFGIHQGTSTEIEGYESSQELLQKKWEDPIRFLKQNDATMPEPASQFASVVPSVYPKTIPVPDTTTENINSGILDAFIEYFQHFFSTVRKSLDKLT